MSEIVPNTSEDEVLILAGDIGDPFARDQHYSKFLKECASNFRYVLVVPGNHEYYNSQPMDFVHVKIRSETEEFDNVFFLNVNKLTSRSEEWMIELDGVTFIGMTLWAPGSKQASITDLATINKMNRSRFSQLHLLHKARLLSTLQKLDPSHTRTVIITHHLPIPELSHPDYDSEEEMNRFYVGECEEIINELSTRFNTPVWVCGHSHHFGSLERDGVIFHLNPRGYHREETGYNPDFYFIV